MEHILVVDDEESVTELFKDFLESNGYRITVAQDGHAALAADERDPADAVITDLTMPGMDGVTLLAQLRIRRPALPAIIVTGYAGADERTIGGRTIVLAKPVALALLAQRLAGLLIDAQTAKFLK